MSRNVKFYYPFLFICLFVVASCNFTEEPDRDMDADDVQVDEKTQPKTDADDQADAVFDQKDYSIPNEVEYIEESNNILIDKFKPIGWSADGKFAYLTEYADEASGGFSVKLVIKNMRSNKNEWEWDYFDQGEGENLNIVWDREYQNFKAKLIEHKIMQSEGLTVKKGNIVLKNTEYRIQMENITQTDPDFGFEVVAESKLYLEKGDTKSLFCVFKEEEPSMIMGAIVTGYIASPNKKLFAVLYQKERRGYEGPPNVVMFDVAGCDLENY